MEHPNAALLRCLLKAFTERDVATVQSIIAEGAVWRFPGARGALAGEYHGREEIAHFLGSVPRLTGGTFHLDLEDVAASDDHAVVLFTGHARRNGKTLENPTALVVRIVEGQAVEFREFVWDLPSVDDFWSQRWLWQAVGVEVAGARLQILDVAGVEQSALARDTARAPDGCQPVTAGGMLQVPVLN